MQASPSVFSGTRNVSGLVRVSKDDIIEISVLQSSGSSLNISVSGARNNVSVNYIDREYTVNAALPAVCHIKDLKSDGTTGGTFTSGSFQTRDLNDLSGSTSFVSLSSNQFTLTPGKYTIEASAPAHQVRYHQTKIRNITDSSDAIIGSSEWAEEVDGVGDAVNGYTRSLLDGEVIITSSKTFELQHRGDRTQITNGFGIAASFGVGEVYAQVKITKLR